MRVAMLLFPDLTQLDLTGPHELLTRIPGARVDVVAKTRAPVTSDRGLTIVPTATFADVPAPDLLFVPGGWGQVGAAADAETLAWVARAGASARWVTSVCTGSLLLGAAGLLRGYRAATHWAFLELLPLVGAIPVADRVVMDRNRITAGGVTAGIDFGLTLLAEIAGRDYAEAVQLALEYNPAPPFRGGHPSVAPTALVEKVRSEMRERLEVRRAALASGSHP